MRQEYSFEVRVLRHLNNNGGMMAVFDILVILV
jgi:hypothetical protein